MSTGPRLSPNFSRAELCCRCGCGFEPTPQLVAALQRLRDTLGAPMKVTSAARCPAHNQAVGGKDRSQHVKGLAVDIAVVGDGLRYRLLQIAFAQGFRGVGFAQTFIHLDVREGAPVAWFYP